MLDIRYIEECKKDVIKNLERRGLEEAQHKIDNLLASNHKRKILQQESELIAQQLNSENKKIAKLLRESKSSIDEQREALIKLKSRYKILIEKFKKQKENFRASLLELPNLIDENLPNSENKVIEQWGEVQKDNSSKSCHWELMELYKLVSLKDGVSITGAGFPIYYGNGAKLQRSLIEFFLDQGEENGYQEIIPPILVNYKAVEGSGQIPDKEGLMYSIKEQNFFLIPTAEVPLVNLYAKKNIDSLDLPIKLVAHTPCFRRESGSWGSHVRGLNRLHQFDKVEIVSICLPEKSKEELEKMMLYVCSLLKKLELTYRVLLLSSKDIGQTATKTYDIEVWSLAQQRWLEVSSISSCGDYQARRVGIYTKTPEGKKTYCHTLNGSALALPRVFAALLEQNQRESNIFVPNVLQKYTKFSQIKIPSK